MYVLCVCNGSRFLIVVWLMFKPILFSSLFFCLHSVSFFFQSLPSISHLSSVECFFSLLHGDSSLQDFIEPWLVLCSRLVSSLCFDSAGMYREGLPDLVVSGTYGWFLFFGTAGCTLGWMQLCSPLKRYKCYVAALSAAGLGWKIESNPWLCCGVTTKKNRWRY